MVHHSGHHRQPAGRRPPGRRALRLVGTVGILSCGLGAVLATTGLVVEFGPRHHDTHKLTIGETVHVYSGSGAGRTRPILIPRAGLYGAAWRFSCGPGGSGVFMLEDNSEAGRGRREVVRAGTSDHGIWRERKDRPVSSLYVVATCSWNVRVFRLASTAAQAPQSGRGGAHKPKHKHNTHKNHGHKDRARKNHGHGNKK
jgi:hypothetical protein